MAIVGATVGATGCFEKYVVTELRGISDPYTKDLTKQQISQLLSAAKWRHTSPGTVQYPPVPTQQVQSSAK